MKLPVKYDAFSIKERKNIREEYVKLQQNKCWYCKGNLDEPPPENVLKYKIHLSLFPKGFLDAPIHLQHDHVTGLTEGAVHGYCNAVLWEYYGK
jgi:hypothetical protein